MYKLMTICAMATVILAGAMAQADSATAYVGTVHGQNAFEVQNGGTQLYYEPQPDTDYVWYENTGAVSTYTYGGVPYNRDGMKTFACTDIAYGEAIKNIKMQFDFCTLADPTTGLPMSNPSMNFFLTDGYGHYGIWSATSGSATYTDTVLGNGWTRRTLDCTAFQDTATVAVYEHNGFVNEQLEPYTPVNWGNLKNFTLAGFYDYQRTPQGGFEAWNQTLWTDITNVANPGDTTLNQFGITINWGDTVGGCNADCSGEIGVEADRAYAQAGRMIANYQITVGETAYDMNFEAGTVPEPTTMTLFAFGMVCLLLGRTRKTNR